MASRLYGASGILAGVPVVLNIQVATNWTAEYVEVHNLSAANTYSCLVNGATFSIPAGRKLSIPGIVADLTLNGTGAYSMYAAESASTLPSLDNISQGSIGSAGSISPPDNITIEDTGVVLQVKDLGISTAKVAAQAINTSKLADLAVNFNKVGSGVNLNPGRGAAVLLDTTAVIVGDTFTLTFIGAPVVYEFTNGGAPAPGNIGVDIPTLPVSLTNAVNANQPLIEASGVFTDNRFGISNQALIQAGSTLTGAGTGGLLVENIAPVSESRVGLEFHAWTITAQNQAGYPIYTSGTIVGKWALETTGGDLQQSSLGTVFIPISGGIVVVPNNLPGFKVNVLLAVQY